jgi:plastocyanin
MMSFGFVVALATLPLAFAQSSGNGTSPAAYTIAVGQNGLVFTPEITNAKVGDHVTFQFFPKNHSVVQADFSNPCNPSEGRSGFYSGFFPTSDGPAKKPFTIRVKDEKPMWIYCGALDSPRPHCAAGMVAVINPP